MLQSFKPIVGDTIIIIIIIHYCAKQLLQEDNTYTGNLLYKSKKELLLYTYVKGSENL